MTLPRWLFAGPLLVVAACTDGSAGATEDSQGEGASSGDDSSRASEGGSGSAGADQCTEHADCRSSVPLCVSGRCVSCDAAFDADAQCALRDAQTPVCSGGECVECSPSQQGACGGDFPVCSEDSVCVPCVAHSQCDAACDMATGACIDRLIIVDRNGDGDFETVDSAVATVGPDEVGAIQITPTESCYVGSSIFASGARIALLGSGEEMPCLTSFSDTPVIELPQGGAVYLWRVRIDNAVGAGIQGQGAHLWLDRSEVVNNQHGGLSFSQNSELVISNSVIGGDRNHVPAVAVRDSDLVASYTTIAAGFGSAVALACSGDGTIRVRNSILVAEASGGEVDCSGARIERSALESAFGQGNVAVGTVDTRSWFLDFAGGDLHLDPEAALMFADVARWEAGDPQIDFDGDPRPTEGGEHDRLDWAGADIPAPR